MTELSNTALIQAIHAHTPQDATPASVLMDILNIGREAAYRRLRGEVRFTFGEASALSAHLRFSLDGVMGSSVGGNALNFRLRSTSTTGFSNRTSVFSAR